MKKKSEMIDSRLRSNFGWVLFGDVKPDTVPVWTSFYKDDDWVLTMNGDASKKIYVYIGKDNDCRLCPTFHKEHFSYVSFEYFKKSLRGFISETYYNNIPVPFRFREWDFESLLGTSHFENSNIFSMVYTPAEFIPKLQFKSHMYMEWRNPDPVINEKGWSPPLRFAV